MRKIRLSAVSILALSGLVFAGGDIVPVEPQVVLPVVVNNSAYYLGIGIANGVVNDDFTNEEFSSNALMLQAGYQYNEYIAFEGRYAFGLSMDYDPGMIDGLSSDYDGDFSNWGLYVKPMYPIGDFNLYALLGYGGVMLEDLVGGDAYEDGFQWGVGTSYAISEQVSVFVDYVSLYDDKGFDYRAKLDDVDSSVLTFGLTYKL